LTDKDIDDVGQLPILLELVDSEIASVTADGAYDGEPSYEVVAARQADPPPDVVIPPWATAVPSKTASNGPTQRDRHIQLIREEGRMDLDATGYGRRNLVETGIGRYKALIGTKLRARTPVNQQGEATIAVELPNQNDRDGQARLDLCPLTQRSQAQIGIISLDAPAPLAELQRLLPPVDLLYSSTVADDDAAGGQQPLDHA
jgi:hypothetical protein